MPEDEQRCCSTGIVDSDVTPGTVPSAPYTPRDGGGSSGVEKISQVGSQE